MPEEEYKEPTQKRNIRNYTIDDISERNDMMSNSSDDSDENEHNNRDDDDIGPQARR